MLQTYELIELLGNATVAEEEAFDIRFEEIVSLVDQDKFEEASHLILDVFKDGTIDIRLVMYLLYAQFEAEGICSLQVVFPLLMQVISDFWDKISPASHRDKYLLGSLTWFFSSIAKKLKRSEKLYKDKKPDRFWIDSLNALQPDTIRTLLEMNHTLSDFLSQKVKEPSLNQHVMFISKWIEGLKIETKESNKPIIAPEPSKKQIPENVQKQSPTPDVLDVSEPMRLLMKKIQAFETFVEEHNFEKAALLGDDIGQILKNFDPSLYFPTLFSQYFALSATHIDSLSQEWENKGSLKWEALQKLYQTDLEGFIQW